MKNPLRSNSWILFCFLGIVPLVPVAAAVAFYAYQRRYAFCRVMLDIMPYVILSTLGLSLAFVGYKILRLVIAHRVRQAAIGTAVYVITFLTAAAILFKLTMMD